jgi:hypothetical protein
MKQKYNNYFKMPGVLIAIALQLVFFLNTSSAAITWKGTTSSSWSNSANWNPASVPTSTDDVVIPSLTGGNSYPVLDATGLQAKTLAIASGATLFGQPGKDLTVHGFVDLDGTFITGNATITILDSLYGAGTLDAGSSIINLAGNMSVTGFTDSTSTVNLNGAHTINGKYTQRINGYTFYDLYVNNSDSGIVLVGGPTVTDTLKMKQGNIALNGQTLTLGSSSSSIGVLVWTAGYITGTSGAFRRWFNTSSVTMGTDAGLFPMGTTSNNNRSLWLAGSPTTGGTVSVLHIDSNGRAFINPPFFDNGGALRVNVRYGAKWVLSNGNSFAASSESMRLQGTGIPGINNVDSLDMSLWNSIAPGSYAAPTGTNTNPLVNRTALSAANLVNTFYIASDTPTNPLPVILMAFTAAYQSGHVDLNWSTASEMNNSYFDIERSLDGADWNAIGRVDGHGNSQVVNNYYAVDNLAGVAPQGIIYYRLKQVDFNNQFTYSEIRSVNFNDAAASMKLWPNPAADQLYISFVNNSGEAGTIRICDLTGKSVYFESVPGNGVINQQVDISNYKQGIYTVQVNSGSGITSEKIYKR